MMAHDSAYAGSHLAMALVNEHQGNEEAAAKSLNSANQFWHDADADLPELKLIRERMAAAN
jgi:hypothetical protein